MNHSLGTLGIAPLPRIQNLRNGISPDSKITRAHQKWAGRDTPVQLTTCPSRYFINDRGHVRDTPGGLTTLSESCVREMIRRDARQDFLGGEGQLAG
jgi:hypothetical protein